MSEVKGFKLGHLEQRSPQFTLSAETRSKNPEKPNDNEDSYFVESLANGVVIAGVFDGMGGHAGGRDASNIAKDEVNKKLKEFFNTTRSENLSQEDIANAVIDALIKANQAVIEKRDSMRQNGIIRNDESIGTTASVVCIYTDRYGKRHAIIGNVGDSRVYKRLTDGTLKQVTLDDSETTAGMDKQQAIRIQEQLSQVSDESQLERELKFHFNNRNRIANYVGREHFSYRILPIPLEEGEELLLCTDGVHDNLTDSEIARQWKGSNPAKNILDAAHRRSKEGKEKHIRSKPDDITAIVIRLSENAQGERKTKKESKKNHQGNWKIVLEGGEYEGFNASYTHEGRILLCRFMGFGSDPEEHPQEIRILGPEDNSGVFQEIEFKLKKLIENANSIDDLRSIFKSLGGIYGSDHGDGRRVFYDAEDILRWIDEASSNPNALNRITRNLGLREKIVSLLQAYRESKKHRNPLQRLFERIMGK